MMWLAIMLLTPFWLLGAGPVLQLMAAIEDQHHP